MPDTVVFSGILVTPKKTRALLSKEDKSFFKGIWVLKPAAQNISDWMELHAKLASLASHGSLARILILGPIICG